MEVHLVPDTNLFFECRSLEQLPWQELGYDPVVLLLTKPVLEEIDKHKKANGRTRDRALEIFGRVRGMLKTSRHESEVRASSPKVVLRRAPNLKPDPTLKEDLDYTKTDEKLIGIVSSLNAQTSGQRGMLFTDDTGPAATADDLAIPYLMINESWRRPPLETAEAKTIKELQKEVAALRAQEPMISIGTCENVDDSNTMAVTRKVATPLTGTEIGGFLAALTRKHPLVSDFTPPTPSTSANASGEMTKIEYSAPAVDDIANYRDVLYPQWIERCRAILTHIHNGRDEIEPSVVLRWPMSNDGTRPALQVRVEFEAKGPLELRRIKRTEENHEDSATRSSPLRLPKASDTQFPPPPKPPSFQQQVIRIPSPAMPKTTQGLDISKLRASALLGENHKQITAMSRILGQRNSAVVKAAAGLTQHDVLFNRSPFETISHRPLQVPRPYIPEPHDAEAFYYDWPTTRAVKKGALTCDLWRHRAGEEVFEFEVLFTKTGEARGVVECTVHAENLTKPEQARVIISRTVVSISMTDLANAMVEACN